MGARGPAPVCFPGGGAWSGHHRAPGARARRELRNVRCSRRTNGREPTLAVVAGLRGDFYTVSLKPRRYDVQSVIGKPRRRSIREAAHPKAPLLAPGHDRRRRRGVESRWRSQSFVRIGRSYRHPISKTVVRRPARPQPRSERHVGARNRHQLRAASSSASGGSTARVLLPEPIPELHCPGLSWRRTLGRAGAGKHFATCASQESNCPGNAAGLRVGVPLTAPRR